MNMKARRDDSLSLSVFQIFVHIYNEKYNICNFWKKVQSLYMHDANAEIFTYCTEVRWIKQTVGKLSERMKIRRNQA